MHKLSSFFSFSKTNSYSLLSQDEENDRKIKNEEIKKALNITTKNKSVLSNLEKQIDFIESVECFAKVSHLDSMRNSISCALHAPQGLINKYTVVSGAAKKWDPERLLLGRHVCLQKIGAQHLLLTTKLGDRIDAVYVEASRFAEHIEDWGGKKCVFSLKGESIEIPGYYFKTLNEEVYQFFSNLGLGLTPWKFLVPEEDDQGYLVRSSDLELLEEALNSNCEIQIFEAKNLDSSTRGTVILTMNQTAIYEQYVSEILTFCFEGVNVMAYNNGGKGLSKGGTTEEHFNQAIETVYQYISFEKDVPDHKIMAKGECFGGASTAWLSAQHPNIYVMLDQTPANFNETAIQIKNNYFISEKVNGFVKFIGTSKLVDVLITKFIASYQLDELVKENRGKQLIHIDVPDHEGRGGDELVPKHHPEKLMSSCSNPTLTKNLGGVHVTHWFSNPVNFKEIMQFMNDNELTTDLYVKSNKRIN